MRVQLRSAMMPDATIPSAELLHCLGDINTVLVEHYAQLLNAASRHFLGLEEPIVSEDEFVDLFAQRIQRNGKS